MKKVITAAILIAALCQLTSCDALQMIKSNPSAIRNYFFPDETYADTEMESYYDVLTDEALTETDEILSNLTELHGELEIYTFPNAEAALVYNDTDAYIIDYTLGRAENICDYDTMLAVADPTGRGSEYFKNMSIKDVEVSELVHELKITLTVADGDSYFKVYGFYTFDPISGGTRGFRGYYGDSINYPGANDPATIYDVRDFEALGVTEDYYIYGVASALATGDFDALAEKVNLAPAVLEKWKTVKIGEYSISRTDFSPNGLSNLIIYIDVIESGHEGLPVGKYNVTVTEGIDTGFVIERLDGEPLYADYDTSDVNTPIGFAYQYAKSFGGSYHPDEQNTENSRWTHDILDFYSFISSHSERVGDYEDFKKFCLNRFAVEDASTVCNQKDFYNHGGHGLSSISCAVSDYTSASGVHTITIDFFADPMRTVVAYTHVFTVVENDELEIYSVERTYDSGLSARGYSL